MSSAVIVDAVRTPIAKASPEEGFFRDVRADDLSASLIRRLVEAADIEAVAVLPHSPLYFRKGRQGGKLVTATFEGVLHVKAPDVLLQLLENGLGPAKAFGCGLLLVRRV